MVCVYPLSSAHLASQLVSDYLYITVFDKQCPDTLDIIARMPELYLQVLELLLNDGEPEISD